MDSFSIAESLRSSRSAFEHSVDGEKDDRSDERHDEARSFSFAIHPKCPANKGCDERPDDSNDHRDDDSTGISSRHDELRQRTNDQSDNRRPNVMHRPSFAFRTQTIQ